MNVKEKLKKVVTSRNAPPSANWLAVAGTLAKPQESKKRARDDTTPRPSDVSGGRKTPRPKKKKKRVTAPGTAPFTLSDEHDDGDQDATKYVAMDCEMVGVGLNGSESVLARVSIVNSRGNVLYDEHVRSKERVVDYRTKYSGIRASDIHRRNALPFATVQQQVATLLEGRIVVGHGLENDFRALQLSHPFVMCRDTAKYRPLQRRRGVPRALRQLCKEVLGVDIQRGEHSPVEDARAAFLIYWKHRKEWERRISSKKKAH